MVNAHRFLSMSISVVAAEWWESPSVNSLLLAPKRLDVELVRNLVAHGDAREGKWRGNWRMEWVASTLTPPPDVVYPALLKLMRTPRLPAVDWTDALTDLNGLFRFGERRNMVSARVPSRSRTSYTSDFVSDVFCVQILTLLYLKCQFANKHGLSPEIYFRTGSTNVLYRPCLQYTRRGVQTAAHQAV